MNRLKPYQFKALQNIFLGLKGEVYLFGSKVDNQRKGGDIDIVWLTNDKECQNLNTKLKLTRDYQKMNDERIDILILPPEDQMSNQEKIFYSSIEKQKLF